MSRSYDLSELPDIVAPRRSHGPRQSPTRQRLPGRARRATEQESKYNIPSNVIGYAPYYRNPDAKAWESQARAIPSEYKIQLEDPQTFGTFGAEGADLPFSLSPEEMLGPEGMREVKEPGALPFSLSPEEMPPREETLEAKEPRAPRKPRKQRESRVAEGGLEDLSRFGLIVEPPRPLNRDAPFERFNPLDPENPGYRQLRSGRNRVLDLHEFKNRHLVFPSEIDQNFFYYVDAQAKKHRGEQVRILSARFITAPIKGRPSGDSHGMYTFKCQNVSTGQVFSTYFIDATTREPCEEDCFTGAQVRAEARRERLIRTPTRAEEKGPTPCEERLAHVARLLGEAIRVATA